MVGIVIVAHGQFASELLATTEFIVGKKDYITSVMTDPKQSVEVLRESISAAIKKVDRGEGTLILTDMFGGTPSNISLSFLNQGKVEVLAGVNLPMLIKLASMDTKMPVQELANMIKEYGKKNIILAGDVLNKADL
ncbi:MAG: PTS sugar transporter subunit IIA [Deltaproteobacteria bacterium]|nr:PTS sugar transporter subunit IIA [Deltaproteobacteria bacterium]MCL5277781.1 PTS sugar transporter subunit IIA [Deltaproteobacteria bacterium]